MNILIIILIVVVTINIIIASIRFFMTKRFEKTLAQLVEINTANQKIWLDIYKKEADELLKGFDIVRKEYHQYLQDQDKQLAELTELTNKPKVEVKEKPPVKGKKN